jgi:hypothetical protein
MRNDPARGGVVDANTYKPKLNGRDEAYVGLFRYDESYRKHYETHKSVGGFRGRCTAPFVLFDFDSEDDREGARQSAIRCVKKIEAYGLPRDQVRIFFTGNKGYHITIPARAFGGFEPSAELPQIMGLIADLIAGDFPHFDNGIYNHNRLVRLTNSWNAGGARYKIPLTFQELCDGDHMEHAKRRQHINTPKPATWPTVIGLRKLYQQAKNKVKSREEKTYTAHRIGPVPEGKRNTTLVRKVGRCVRAGYSKEKVIEQAHRENREHFQPPLPDQEVSDIVERNYDTWRANLSIDDVRSINRPMHERYRTIAEMVIERLDRSGSFYYDGVYTYYFDKDKKRLTRFTERDQGLKLLLRSFGISPADSLFKWVYEELDGYAREHGTQTTVHRVSYYDQKTHTVYRHNHGALIYRIRPDGSPYETISNGEDGILFLSDPMGEEFEATPPIVEHLLDRVLLRYIHLDADEHHDLSMDDQLLLFEYWFFSNFFRSILPTRPILCCIGDSGSGKSLTLRKCGILLHGSQFQVQTLSNRELDLDVALGNSSFVVLDNVDYIPPWFQDRLAQAATGVTIRKRKLYSDTDLVTLPIDCMIAISSRTPGYTREDVSDRLLLFRFSRIPESEFLPEKRLLDELNENVSEVQGAINERLQEICRALRDGQGRTTHAPFRMADFGAFSMAVAKHDGLEGQMVDIFHKMTDEQARFTLADEPIAELLEYWMEDAENHERPVDLNTLRRELARLAETNNIDFKKEAENPRRFRAKIVTLKAKLGTRFDITVETNDARQQEWRFSRKKQRAMFSKR